MILFPRQCLCLLFMICHKKYVTCVLLQINDSAKNVRFSKTTWPENIPSETQTTGEYSKMLFSVNHSRLKILKHLFEICAFSWLVSYITIPTNFLSSHMSDGKTTSSRQSCKLHLERQWSAISTKISTIQNVFILRFSVRIGTFNWHQIRK